VTPAHLLEVRDLRVEVDVQGRAEALRGVNLDVGRGEIVGLVGESGCGKTTTALAVMRLFPDQLSPTTRLTSSVSAWIEHSRLNTPSRRQIKTRRRRRRLAALVWGRRCVPLRLLS